jgi:periplasmic protein TonB
MKNSMEFEDLVQSVLHDVANPSPADDLEQKVLRSSGVLSSACVEPSVATHHPERQPSFAQVFAAENIWVSLWHGLRETLFPHKLPPLVLESRPVAVADRMAVDRDPSSTAYAVAVHAFAILLIGFVVRAQIREADPVRTVTPLTDPPVLHVVARASSRMGGGGGQIGATPVSKGRLPRLADQQIVPPKAPPLDPPKIAMEPTVVVQQNLKLADNVLPNVGMPSSPLDGVSMGNGRGNGIGPGTGPGIGPGSGGNIGDGLRHVGGSVSKPEVLYMVEPEFTEQARKAKLSGDVTVYLWVDAQGNPTHIRVAQGLGMGLDERAVEAVKQYKFRPAMENGKPVPVEMYIVVDFTIL